MSHSPEMALYFFANETARNDSNIVLWTFVFEIGAVAATARTHHTLIYV